MSQGNPFKEETGGLPKTLKVLTVLTFIGCGLSYVFTLAMPGLMKFSQKMMDKAVSSGAELSPKDLADIEKGKEAILLAQANMVPLIIVGLVSTTLCLFGAIWMRKLKKDGYWIYTAGELMPIATNIIFLGTEQFKGVSNIVLGLVIPIVFVALYTSQRKYLMNSPGNNLS
jgi:hypothetical protein